MGLFTRRGRAVAPRGTGLRTLTAAASLLEADEERTAFYQKRLADWVIRAWQFHNLIPEVRYATRYFSDCIAQMIPYPAIRPDPFSEPIPLDPEGDAEAGYTADEAAAAIDVIARLRNPHGGPAEILRRFGAQLFMAGEAHFMGRDDEDFGERFDVYSTRELVRSDGRWELREPGTDQGGVGKAVETFATGDVMVVRIWRPHPEWSAWSDSPMRAAEMILDELLVLTKAINAVALSRVSGAGILFLPNSIRNHYASQTDGTSGGQAAARDTVVADMITAAGTAISDPGSAASQVPLTVWVPDAVYSEIGSDKLIRWSRELDEVMERQREALLRRYATAVDLPAEVLTGMGDVKYWNLQYIGAEGFRAHFEPTAQLIFNGLTTMFFRPALEEAGVVDPDRFLIWYDPSGLVSPPDQSEAYLALYDRLEVSGDSLRRATGVSDDEKPDDAEIAKRLEWAALLGAPRGSVSSSSRAPGLAHTPVMVLDAPAPLALEAVATVAEPEPIKGLAETLAGMDTTLMRDVMVNADAAFRRALERANQRIKSLTRGDRALAAKVKDLTAGDLAIAPALGPDTVAQLAAGEDLLAGAFDQLGVDFRRRTGRTAEETIRLAVLHGELSDSEAAVLLDQMDQDRNAAWALLLAALLAVGTEKLYRPLPDEGPGEVSDHLVPSAIVRASLARAGGGGQAATSMLTGETVSSVFRQARIVFQGWEWVYGDPSTRLHPFEPHRVLAGERLTGPDDPKLRWSGSFPPGGR